MDDAPAFPTDIYVAIEGDPFLSAARDYRDAWIAYLDAWRAFAQSKDAEGIPGGFGGHRPGGLNFSGSKAPAGWTKPGGRHGYSRPKKGSEDEAAMAALPVRPDPRTVFGAAIVTDLSYHGPDCRGSGAVGRSFEPWIGWAGDIFLARIPHAGNAARNHLARHPDHTIDGDALSWSVPAGLREITEAEKDFIFAKHALEQEQSKAAA